MSGLVGPVIQNTDGIIGEGRALFDLVAGRGMEGIVAKRLGSRYTPGRRGDSWIKIKVPGYARDRWSEWFDGGAQRQREPA
jgi:bifunctional non-homologous end joining protein LigD